VTAAGADPGTGPPAEGEAVRIEGLRKSFGASEVLRGIEMGFARDIARRVCFLAEGVIVEDAPPSVLFTEPKDERARRFLRRIVEAGRL